MRPLEFLGIGRDAWLFRAPASPRTPINNEEIKGMTFRLEPDVDPVITKAILASKPDSPTKRRLVGTYAEWISDSLVSQTDGNDEVVNVMRAIVSDNKPLSIDRVAALTGTEVKRVENLVGKLPFVEVDDRDGQKQIDMPDVQEYIGKWKEKAVQKLPEGTDPEIIDHLLTPAPSSEIEVFNANQDISK
jgi:hypothetical protein